jgi:hypothetical protein
MSGEPECRGRALPIEPARRKRRGNLIVSRAGRRRLRTRSCLLDETLRQMLDRQDTGRASGDDHALERVLELADIARPAMAIEHIQHRGINRERTPPAPYAQSVHDRTRQRREIACTTMPQWGYV